MAPSKSKPNSMKQKSLLSWLSKPDAKSSQANRGKPSDRSTSHAHSTPDLRGPGVGADSQPLGGRISSMAKEATISRDVIDVDMLSAEEGQQQNEHGQIKVVGSICHDLSGKYMLLNFRIDIQARVKRKVVVESDEEDASASAKSQGRVKKPRVSPAPPDDDNEDGEGLASFSSRLTKFRRSPSGLCAYFLTIAISICNDVPFQPPNSKLVTMTAVLFPLNLPSRLPRTNAHHPVLPVILSLPWTPTTKSLLSKTTRLRRVTYERRKGRPRRKSLRYFRTKEMQEIAVRAGTDFHS